jgi:hypothetical protein
MGLGFTSGQYVLYSLHLDIGQASIFAHFTA